MSLLAIGFFSVPSADAQFLRLGPFEFSAQAGLDLIYSSNVEGERPSEAERQRQDYYMVYSLDLTSTPLMGPRTRLALNAGYSKEKYYERSDLDVDLGSLGISFVTDFSPLTLSGGYEWERDTEYEDEIFIPQGKPRAKRRVGNTTTYDAAADFDSRHLLFGVSYEFTEERFEKEEYAEDEKDERKIIPYVEVLIDDYVGVRYEVENTVTDFINDDEDETEETTEKITIITDQLFGLLERPKVTYSIGIQREYEDGETDGWELVHTLDVSDKWDFSPTLSLDAFARYNYEQDPEEDDITLEYGVVLKNQLSSRTSHEASARRKPVETLGSTEETDETEYGYKISIKDILIRDLAMNAGVTYTISRPADSDEETEKIWDYLFEVVHTKEINANLRRTLSYAFTREDSNLEEELLDEHKVTLSFSYRF